MLNDVAKSCAEDSVEEKVQSVLNAKTVVADEDIEKETNGDLSKDFLSQILNK